MNQIPQIEEKILKFWRKNKIIEKGLKLNKGKKKFVFFEGPPTANGKPGMHHVEARAFKDIIPRYKTMRGFFVDRKAGWDTHGLPVELEVEKELGLRNKDEIEKYGIAKFNKKCQQSVWKYKDKWEKMTERIAFWIDMKDPYITYENEYIESVWHILKKVWDKGLLFRGFKIVPLCTRCGTVLSSHEVSQGYKKIKENSVYLNFKITKGNKKIKKGDIILAWTTTPWTLPGNVALAVGKNIDYVKVSLQNKKYILAKSRLGIISGDYKIIDEFLGRDLIDIEYQPLFEIESVKKTGKKAYYVIPADFVSTEDGTGVVHTAVMYGEEDYELGKEVGLPEVHTVTEKGYFTKDLAKYDLLDKFVKDKEIENKILAYLKKNDLLFKEEPYEHDYPFCWRCETPLLYYAKESWFIGMSKLRKELVKNNNEIYWEPNHIKKGRFGVFIKEAKDWALSRERYWGTPLPIWQCQKCGKIKAIGGFKELSGKTKKNNYFILRHGQTKNNITNRIYTDGENKKAPLTKEGERRINKLIPEFKKAKIDLIFSSDYFRTRQTASMVSKSLNIKIIYDKKLRDLNSGIFKGKYIKEYLAYFKNNDLLRFTKIPPKGENLNQVKKRMMNFLLAVNKKYSDKNILIISHGAPLWILEGAVQGFKNEEIIKNASNRIKTGQFRSLEFKNLPFDNEGNLNLHRPFVDKVVLDCSCGGKMIRDPSVIDVWFDSGAMSFAQWHYPFTAVSKKKFKDHYPADYICEAIDQTRGWFYSLLAIATLMQHVGEIKDGYCFKNCICLGHVLDKKGKKMSKSLGNIVDPWEMCDEHGADALRWYLYTINQAGEPKRFNIKDVIDKNRRFFGTLLNSYIFFDTYKGGEFRPKQTRSNHVLDKWIKSRFNSLSELVINNLEKYDVVTAARAIDDFVDDFSNWYIRRSRGRLQKPKNKKEHTEASQTLHWILFNLAKLTAPFAPFITEEIYLNIKTNKDPQSVHLCDYPKPDRTLINKELEERMWQVREIAALALAQRAQAGIKVRQPLLSLNIKNKALSGDKGLLDLIREEINVKKVVYNSKIKQAVKLDIKITNELKTEGMVRDFIRFVQGMRKDGGLEPGQEIHLYYSGNDFLNKLIQKNKAEIKREVSAKKIEARLKEKEIFLIKKEVVLDNQKIWLGIKK